MLMVASALQLDFSCMSVLMAVKSKVGTFDSIYVLVLSLWNMVGWYLCKLTESGTITSWPVHQYSKTKDFGVYVFGIL